MEYLLYIEYNMPFKKWSASIDVKKKKKKLRITRKKQNPETNLSRKWVYTFIM
jgi:hypothetical protein